MSDLQCPECGEVHRDGDKVEVRSDGRTIAVVCKTHAVWANRHAIKELRDSWKLAPNSRIEALTSEIATLKARNEALDGVVEAARFALNETDTLRIYGDSDSLGVSKVREALRNLDEVPR